MTKTKTAKVPTKIAKSKIEMAQDVAAHVEIVEVKLADTHAMQKIVGGKQPKNIGYGQRCTTKRSGENTIEVRADFVLRASDSETPTKTITDEVGSHAMIHATFSLSYKVSDLSRFSDAQINAFGDVNGVYNAWPFWREYVYSTLARMGLKPFTLPVYRFEE